MDAILIDRNHPYLCEIERLYNQSFPDNERIPFPRLLNGLSEQQVMYGYLQEGQLAGMAFFYILDDLAYLSYLAVEESIRGRGYGSAILEKIRNDYHDYRIVLDIEDVKEDALNYETRKKRRNFYINNGFEGTDIFYHIYHVDYEILACGNKVTKEDWQRIIRYFWGPFAEKAVFPTVK